MSTESRNLTVVFIFAVYPCLSLFIEGTSTLPRVDESLSVGYDTDTDTILILGGQLNATQFVTLKDHIFTDYGSSYLTTSHSSSYSQDYTQIGNELWMIPNSGTTFVQFNTETYTATTPSITIPTSTDAYACLTSIDGYLILVGGGSKPLKTTHIYRFSDSQWLPNVPSLNAKRTKLSCVVAEDKVWAIGGYGGSMGVSIYLDSIETLDISNIDIISTKSWDNTWAKRLISARDGTRSVVYATDIYVVGGYGWNGNADSPLSDINVIDAITGNVAVGDTLAYPTSYAGSIIVGNTLYAFGGWGDAYLNKYQYSTLPALNSGMTHSTVNPTSYSTETLTVDPSSSSTTVEPSGAPIFNPTIHTSIDRTIAGFTDSTIDEINDGRVREEVDEATEAPTSDLGSDAKYDENGSFYTILWIVSGIVSVFVIIVCVMCIWRGNEKRKESKQSVGQLCMSDTVNDDKVEVQQVIVSEGDMYANPVDVLTATITGDSTNEGDAERSRELVNSWLTHTVKLPQYYPLFIVEGFDSMRAIKAIQSRPQLAELGIKPLGHQALIFSEIQKIVNNDKNTESEHSNELEPCKNANDPYGNTAITIGAMKNDKIALGVISTSGSTVLHNDF